MSVQILNLEAVVGQQITVPVKDMPSAGYRWVLTSISTEVVLESARRLHMPSDDLPPKERLIGGERPKEFYLWARRSGEATVVFELLRSFEPEEVAERLVVLLSISPRTPNPAPEPFGEA